MRPTTTVSSERVRSYKPDVTPFIIALEELDLPGGSVLHVGDSPTADVLGASNAGIQATWVNRYGAVYPEDLPRPLWELEDLSTLPKLLMES
jgi:FMN phosphatase YigB (HAD superfamily)